MNKTATTSFALSVAALVLAGCGKQASSGQAESAESSKKVKCMGVNECKGQGLCGTAAHTCAGQNECKGKGWLSIPKSECDAKGGKVI